MCSRQQLQFASGIPLTWHSIACLTELLCCVYIPLLIGQQLVKTNTTLLIRQQLASTNTSLLIREQVMVTTSTFIPLTCTAQASSWRCLWYIRSFVEAACLCGHHQAIRRLHWALLWCRMHRKRRLRPTSASGALSVAASWRTMTRRSLR